MGAVLHGQYSYVHVAQMLVKILAATPPAQRQQNDLSWVGVQLGRIAEGQTTLRAYARGTPAGEAFLSGLDAWTTRVLETGKALL
jgi:hypothetical protein